MDRIEYFAEISIRRALAFATFGVMTTMMGLLFDPVLALKTAAVLVGIVAVTLAYKAHNAPRRPYRSTEVWMMLEKSPGIPEERLQLAIGGVLSRLYWRYAELAGWLAAALWLTGFTYGLAR